MLALLVALFLATNYPGDFYLFRGNDFFYHPEWVPGIWVEDRLHLHHNHLDAVIMLRLPALLLLAALLAGLVLLERRQHSDAIASQRVEQAEAG